MQVTRLCNAASSAAKHYYSATKAVFPEVGQRHVRLLDCTVASLSERKKGGLRLQHLPLLVRAASNRHFFALCLCALHWQSSSTMGGELSICVLASTQFSLLSMARLHL